MSLRHQRQNSRKNISGQKAGFLHSVDFFPLNSRRCVTVTNIYYSSAFSNCQDGSTAAAEETNEQDVVLIKQETPKEEAESDLTTTDELLISEDGEQTSKMYLIPGGGSETLCGC